MLTVLLTSGEQIDYPDAHWVRIDDRSGTFFRFVCYRAAGDGSGVGELARFQVKCVKAYILDGTRIDVRNGKAGELARGTTAVLPTRGRGRRLARRPP